MLWFREGHMYRQKYHQWRRAASGGEVVVKMEVVVEEEEKVVKEEKVVEVEMMVVVVVEVSFSRSGIVSLSSNASSKAHWCMLKSRCGKVRHSFQG